MTHSLSVDATSSKVRGGRSYETVRLREMEEHSCGAANRGIAHMAYRIFPT
jgi:hypothetical protein